jgi:small subunit ribosomal protein S8
MITDPISDMLTRVRNAISSGKSSVVMPYSKFKHNLARLLVAEGWLAEVFVREQAGKKMLGVGLKFGPDRTPVIQGLKRVSKPGQRIYANHAQIPRSRSGIGITIVSTSRGLMSDRQAYREKVGGEVIAQLW